MVAPRDVIGQWTVLGPLGHPGSFADVYRVSGEGGEFALKLCRRTEQPDEMRMEMEVDALVALAPAPEEQAAAPAPGEQAPGEQAPGGTPADMAVSPPVDGHRSFPRLVDRGRYEGHRFLVMTIAPGLPLKNGIERAEARGAAYGDIETMRILRGLLYAVWQVHQRNLVHRDIKDGNVLYDDPSGAVTLIDFGFCKGVGMGETITDDSFLRAGAPRFNPPGKLDNPARAEFADDIFAVGVVGYRLLVGEYPWEAGPRQDLSALRAAMEQRQLVPVHERNSRVLRPVSEIISKLLQLQDYRRPNARDALREIVDFLASVRQQQRSGRIARAMRLRYPHRVRDPLYGDVQMTVDEWRVLGTPQVQRLRYLKQLGLTELVFPGATHTRFSHAIGRLARTEQILASIEQREGLIINDDVRRAARIYALTHDVTQIPFGNTIEDELGFFERHDRNRPRAERVLGDGSELAEALSEIDAGRIVLDHLAGAESQGIVKQLVTGPVGADVLDYVNRDALFCGLDDRIDSAVLRHFHLRESDRLSSVVGDKYGLRWDRAFAVESVLRTRYALFMKVYTNRSKAAASALLGRALTAAIHRPDASPYLAEQDLEQHDDESLLSYLRTHSDPAVRAPAEQLRRRQLPRGVYRAVLLPDHADRAERNSCEAELESKRLLTPAGRKENQELIARAAGVPPEKVTIHCPARAPGYRLVRYSISLSANSEVTRQASLGELEQKHLNLWELWVFADQRLTTTEQDAVARESQRRVERPNLINIHRKEGRL